MCFAECKVNLAFAYANRSAVYTELGRFDESLQNIQLARENEYPKEKFQKLIDREQKCKQMKAILKQESVIDIKDFFKLSYPANPKIPFVIDGLQAGKTKKYGRRGIFTTRDLKPGDIIGYDEGILKSAQENSSYTRCCNCTLANFYNLIPCSKSASLMFCSEKCRDKVYKDVENLDSMVTKEEFSLNPERFLREIVKSFGSREDLIQFLKRNDYKKFDCTIFDFDFRDPDNPECKKNLIKCVLSFYFRDPIMKYHFDEEAYYKPLVKAAAGDDLMIEKFLLHFALIHEKRGHRSEVGSPLDQTVPDMFKNIVFGVSTFSPHINHRCDPNIGVVASELGRYLLVLKPIKAGNELFQDRM